MKNITLIIVAALLGTVTYGFVRNLSIDLHIQNFSGECTLKQKIVDTVITRNCSIFLQEG